MYELKKKWRGIFTSKFVGTGPSSYEKRIYGAAVSQRLRNNAVECYRAQVARFLICDVSYSGKIKTN